MNIPPKNLAHASLWRCEMLIPTRIDQIKALCERGHPVWVVSCTHPVPALHRVGRRRAMVAMLLTQPPAEIARQLGVSLKIIKEDIRALTAGDRALAQDDRQRKVQIIKKKYGTVSTRELAAQLGMTRNAVIGAARRLGLSRSETGSRPAVAARDSGPVQTGPHISRVYGGEPERY